MNRDSNATWSLSPDVRATYTEDGALVLDVPKEICYSLNASASRMWLAMESSPSGITLEGIVGAIETNFAIPHQELEGDAAECLDKLERRPRSVQLAPVNQGLEGGLKRLRSKSQD